MTGDDGREYSAGGPVVILTYPYSGSEVLTELLSASRHLACTSETGLLPTCQAAMRTWQAAEGRPAQSQLAIKSVRSLASAIITVIQAEAGARRWCETAFAQPAAASTFLQLFPTTTFLCLHSSLPRLLSEATARHPWGLGGTVFWQHALPHPGNGAATIAAYWASRTESLLTFEDEHPSSCVRLRQEDLIAEPAGTGRDVFERLGLDYADLRLLRRPAEPVQARTDPAHNGQRDFPADQIPENLLAKINELQARLQNSSP